MTSSPRSLAAEVWLGPMEGLRYVVETPGFNQAIRIGRLPFDRRSKEKNHLLLSAVAGVSGSHAEVRLAGARCFLKDLGSANGTFSVGKAVTSEVELKPWEVFLVSLTPVQAFLASPEAVLPPFEPVAAADWQDPALSPIIASATEAATRCGERYIDTRHLLEALLRSSDARFEEPFALAGWSRRSALELLFTKDLFEERFAWLAEDLIKPVVLTAKFADVVVSPKVARLFDAVRARGAGLGGTERTAAAMGAIFTAILSDSQGPVGKWLVARSVRPLSEATVVEAFRGGEKPVRKELPAPPPAVPPAEPSAPPAAVSPPAVPPPPGPVKPPAPPAAVEPPPREKEKLPDPSSPGDRALTARARDLAGELFELYGAHRFDSADDRRKVLSARVGRDLAALSREDREKLLHALGRQLPLVSEGPKVDEEITRLKRRIDELERQKAEEVPARSAAGPQKATALPLLLRQLASGEDLSAADREAMVLRQVLEFAISMEGMVLGLVQSLTMPGNETMQFRLPQFRETIQSVLHSIAEGKGVNSQRTQDYLEELKRWQIALLAAFHQAPADWFDRLWKRINPTTIESAPRSAGWKLRGEAADWWELYRQGVKDLGPDVVHDQVLQAVARIARAEFEKLKKSQ